MSKTWQPFPIDDLLRRANMRIAERPKDGPVIWITEKGQLLIERLAVVEEKRILGITGEKK